MFDLLDRPLVFVPVKWQGIKAADDGGAETVEHRVDIQIEMLDSTEFEEWARLGSLDPVAAERAALMERINAASIALENGTDGAAAMLTALGAEGDALREKAKPLIIARDLESFRRVAKGWRNIKANGRNPDFSDANINSLLRWPGFGDAFGKAVLKAYQGQAEVREGNSAGSPGNGPAGEPTGETPAAETSKS